MGLTKGTCVTYFDSMRAHKFLSYKDWIFIYIVLIEVPGFVHQSQQIRSFIKAILYSIGDSRRRHYISIYKYSIKYTFVYIDNRLIS